MIPIVEKALRSVLRLVFSRNTESQLVINNEILATIPQTLVVTSSEFTDGGVMPAIYGGDDVGDNKAPPLQIGTVPEETSSLVVICQDLDAPLPSPILHLLAYNVPASKTVFGPEELTEQNPESPIKFGLNFRGVKAYLGFRPLLNDGPHRYYFQVFALKDGSENDRSQLEGELNLKQILQLLATLAIAKGVLIGTFERLDS